MHDEKPMRSSDTSAFIKNGIICVTYCPERVSFSSEQAKRSRATVLYLSIITELGATLKAAFNLFAGKEKGGRF